MFRSCVQLTDKYRHPKNSPKEGTSGPQIGQFANNPLSKQMRRMNKYILNKNQISGSCCCHTYRPSLRLREAACSLIRRRGDNCLFISHSAQKPAIKTLKAIRGIHNEPTNGRCTQGGLWLRETTQTTRQHDMFGTLLAISIADDRSRIAYAARL